MEVANTLNNFFKNAVATLAIPEIDHHLIDSVNIRDPIKAIIKKYSDHPSILKINETVTKGAVNFKPTDIEEIQNEISILKTNVSCPSGIISSSLLRDNIDICSKFLLNILNFGITNSTFDNGMKFADVTPIFKTDESIRKENYRPISCLSAESKIFERILQKQIATYIETYLSPFICGYRKGYCTQFAIITLLEKWRIALDNKGYGGAILTDLSKAFVSLNHELLVAKLNAYGFTHSSLCLIYLYLSDRWQRTKINNKFSSWVEIMLGVPQGSILGPLLFNIYLNDLCFLDIKSDLCNFADDNTLYSCDVSLNVLVEKLETSAKSVIEWFGNNYMKLNESKCKILVCGNKEEVIIASVGISKIIESHKITLLGTHIDRELKYDDHVNNIYKAAGKKLNALIRMCSVIPFHKRRLLMKAFIESQFAYSPLVSIFHSRILNNKINLLHYCALKVVYQNE